MLRPVNIASIKENDTIMIGNHGFIVERIGQLETGKRFWFLHAFSRSKDLEFYFEYPLGCNIMFDKLSYE